MGGLSANGRGRYRPSPTKTSLMEPPKPDRLPPLRSVLFKKGRNTKDELFIDASGEYAEGTNQNRLGEDHIKKIVAAYRAFQTVPKYAYRASPEEIGENDYNLNLPRYVDTFEAEKAVDLRAVQKEIEALEVQLADVRKQMAGYLRELGV